MQLELDVLNELTMQDKSSLSPSLRNIDEGNLVLPRMELIPFLRLVDDHVREFTLRVYLQRTTEKISHNIY